MRQNHRVNPQAAKLLARRKYAERQIDKWWKWSWEKRKSVKYKELVSYQDKYNIKVYGKEDLRQLEFKPRILSRYIIWYKNI